MISDVEQFGGWGVSVGVVAKCVMQRVEMSGNDRGEAVAELYRTNRQRMVRLAYVLTRDSEDADDLVQDAFVALHRNWDRVERPEAYLRTAVVNACHSHHRHLRVVREAAWDSARDG